MGAGLPCWQPCCRAGLPGWQRRAASRAALKPRRAALLPAAPLCSCRVTFATPVPNTPVAVAAAASASFGPRSLSMTLRVRLDFHKTFKLSELQQSWMVVTDDMQVIGDLCGHLVRTYSLRKQVRRPPSPHRLGLPPPLLSERAAVTVAWQCAEGLVLRLDGFLLPAFQPIAVLRDGDLLQVEPRQGGGAPKRKRDAAAAADAKSAPAALASKAEPKPAASTAAAAVPKRKRGSAAAADQKGSAAGVGCPPTGSAVTSSAAADRATITAEASAADKQLTAAVGRTAATLALALTLTLARDLALALALALALLSP